MGLTTDIQIIIVTLMKKLNHLTMTLASNINAYNLTKQMVCMLTNWTSIA